MKFQGIKKLKQRLLNNLWMKIGSFIFALFIWFTIQGQGQTDKTFMNISFELRNIPRNLEVVERSTDFVQVTARGPQNLIDSIRHETISVPIELPNDVGPGEYTLELKTSKVQRPYANQIRILQISPPEIAVKLERKVTKSVKIRPYITGSPARGYELGKQEVIPFAAEILGPASIVETVEHIFTEPIDINGVNKTLLNLRVELQSPEELLKIVTPLKATVTIEIKEKIVDQVFNDHEISLMTSENQNEIFYEPKTTDLSIQAPQLFVDSLKPDQITIYADCRDLLPGRHMVGLSIKNDSNKIQSYSTDPPAIEVIIPTPKPTAAVDDKSTEKPDS